jgi:hypothetical protein
MPDRAPWWRRHPRLAELRNLAKHPRLTRCNPTPPTVNARRKGERPSDEPTRGRRASRASAAHAPWTSGEAQTTEVFSPTRRIPLSPTSRPLIWRIVCA